MRTERYLTASRFLDEVGDFLREAEAENVLILGVAQALANGEQAKSESPYFAAVFIGDRPVVAAFSNHSEKLGITRATHEGAVVRLVDDVVAARPALASIGGPEPTSGSFAAEYAARTGRRIDSRMGTRIHELTKVLPPTRVPPGAFRAAVGRDQPHLEPWVAEFLRDIGDQTDPAEVVAERVQAGKLFVWDDGGPVSMAAWTGKTANGARVNLVFTPVALRGKGYASATVAALSQHLLDSGNSFCSLYTDVANPISNAIYARMGYRPVAEAGMYFLREE